MVIYHSFFVNVYQRVDGTYVETILKIYEKIWEHMGEIYGKYMQSMEHMWKLYEYMEYMENT